MTTFISTLSPFVFFIAIVSCSPRDKALEQKVRALDQQLADDSAEVTRPYYADFKIIQDNQEKYPKEAYFSGFYVSSAKAIVTLADTLATKLMAENADGRYAESSVDFFKAHQRGQELYQRMRELHGGGVSVVADSLVKRNLQKTFKKTMDARSVDEWIDVYFRDASAVEALAELRQFQTDCYTALELVMHDVRSGLIVRSPATQP